MKNPYDIARKILEEKSEEEGNSFLQCDYVPEVRGNFFCHICGGKRQGFLLFQIPNTEFIVCSWCFQDDFYYGGIVPAFKVGVKVQWECNGMYQFGEPKRIVKIEYLKEKKEFFYFVEGVSTGIPENQIRIKNNKK